MKTISLEEICEILEHINRMTAKLNFPSTSIENKVKLDCVSMINRELGLKSLDQMCSDDLYFAHEFIDSYEPPFYITRVIKHLEVINNFLHH